MKILRSYILKDFFGSFIFSLLSLSLIMVIGNVMKLSDMIIRKGVNILDALKIFMFFIPYLLGFTLPLAFLLGVLLCMGRLISDNEIVAINVAGISLTKILNVFLLLGVIGSLFVFILNSQVIPDFHYRYRTVLKSVYTSNASSMIEPGQFMEQFQNYVLYVSDREGNKLKNVFIYELDKNRESSKVTFAKWAEFIMENNVLKLKLEEGFRDEAATGMPAINILPDTKQAKPAANSDSTQKKNELYRLNFKVFFMDIPVSDDKVLKIEKKPSDMGSKELREKINYFRVLGINPTELTAEFHKRISFSFAIITFILLGAGVSLIVKHREKSINFGIAFICAGIYYLLFILGQTLVEYNFLPAMLGMWLANIIMTTIGCWLIFKNAHFR